MAGLIRQLEAAGGMTNMLDSDARSIGDTDANGRSDPEPHALGLVSALMHFANRTAKCIPDPSGRVIGFEPIVPEHVYEKCKEHLCIPFVEEFTHQTVGHFLEHHEALMTIAKNKIHKQLGNPNPKCRNNVNIVWVIDSGGGDTSAVMMIVDTVAAMDAFNDEIRKKTDAGQADHPVGRIVLHTLVLTRAWSCGAVMFSMASPGNRYVTNHSTVLFHQPRSVYGAERAPISFSAGSATDMASTLKLLGKQLYTAAEKKLLPPNEKETDTLATLTVRRNVWFEANMEKLTEILMRNRNGFAVRSGMKAQAVSDWLIERSQKVADKEPILLFLMLDVYENNTDHFMSSDDLKFLEFAKKVSEVWTYPGGVMCTHVE